MTGAILTKFGRVPTTCSRRIWRSLSRPGPGGGRRRRAGRRRPARTPRRDRRRSARAGSGRARREGAAFAAAMAGGGRSDGVVFGDLHEQRAADVLRLLARASSRRRGAPIRAATSFRQSNCPRGTSPGSRGGRPGRSSSPGFPAVRRSACRRGRGPRAPPPGRRCRARSRRPRSSGSSRAAPPCRSCAGPGRRPRQDPARSRAIAITCPPENDEPQIAMRAGSTPSSPRAWAIAARQSLVLAPDVDEVAAARRSTRRSAGSRRRARRSPRRRSAPRRRRAEPPSGRRSRAP